MNSNTILSQIADKVRHRLESRKRLICPELARQSALSSREPQEFSNAFRKERVPVIAEVKYASPSEGVFTRSSNLCPEEVAKQYLNAGAVALSVLTEEDYFHGSSDYLTRVRSAHPDAYILMKDFIIDPYQLFEARSNGADAVLLMISLLGKEKAKFLFEVAGELKLSVLMEVHDEEEMTAALSIGAKMIGINNRNLKTLEVSLSTSLHLAGFKRKEILLVSESGLRSSADLCQLKASGFDGFLIGSKLMKSGNPGRALSDLILETEAKLLC